MKFSTKAIHIGQEPDKTTGAIIPPIYQTSTFALEHPTDHKGFEYTRHGNPNYTNLEETLAALENGTYSTVFGSGMAAATALTSVLKSGDRVVSIGEVYGGTYRLFKQELSRYGISYELVDGHDLDLVKTALAPPTKLLLFETPTNPRLKIVDVALMVKLAKEHGVLVAVDNTFASPYFQNPLKLGVDVVWHSTTKYIGGHSDLVGGVLVTNDVKLKEHFDVVRTTMGLTPAPFDCWLATRGVKTLELRMIQHEKNAKALIGAINGHSLIKNIYYPGLESHPHHAIAKKQMSGFGGMFSVEFDLSLEETLKLISSFRYFSLAISLGGVESLVNHSASMSHVNVPKEKRLKLGISDGLVRFSAGIENTDDLVTDFADSLANL